MGLSSTFTNPKYRAERRAQIVDLAPGTAALDRNEALDVIDALTLAQSKLKLAEAQAAEFRDRLEEGGLLPRR